MAGKTGKRGERRTEKAGAEHPPTQRASRGLSVNVFDACMGRSSANKNGHDLLCHVPSEGTAKHPTKNTLQKPHPLRGRAPAEIGLVRNLAVSQTAFPLRLRSYVNAPLPECSQYTGGAPSLQAAFAARPAGRARAPLRAALPAPRPRPSLAERQKETPHFGARGNKVAREGEVSGPVTPHACSGFKYFRVASPRMLNTATTRKMASPG